MRVRTLITLTALFSLTGSGQSPATYDIAGQVLDPRNNPIDGVLVSAYRGATPVAGYTTKADGKYSLNYRAGATISVILYENTDWYPAKVAEISGSRSHTINKVMYRTGTRVPPETVAEALGVFQTISVIQPKGFSSDVEGFSRKSVYTKFIESLVVPDSLAPWKSQVQTSMKQWNQ